VGGNGEPDCWLGRHIAEKAIGRIYLERHVVGLADMAGRMASRAERERVMFNVLSFCTGALACLAVVAAWATQSDDIDREDFYRFCMVNKIELQDCVTPARPYKPDIIEEPKPCPHNKIQKHQTSTEE
jgi:hypothetical protein